MHGCFVDAGAAPGSAIAIEAVRKRAYPDWLKGAGAAHAAWLDAVGFRAEAGQHVAVPCDVADGGAAAKIVLVVGETPNPWDFGALPMALAEKTHAFAPAWPEGWDADAATFAAMLGWGLGSYQFTRYKKAKRGPATLVTSSGVAAERAGATVAATWLARDLINTPASDLGPAALAAAARDMAERHGASVSVIVGDDLLEQGYPAVHAVGRASSAAPRLIDIGWRSNSAGGLPKLRLIGKGVCFDTGGLDLKPAAGMKLMKKDMGGAANILGLASMIMRLQLPVDLRVLVPAVENAVSGNAMRPLDVLQTRKGLTVEVGNTDAEGRLILCDALAEAARDAPDLMIDMATLTGAARVALGQTLPAMFCNDDATAEALLRAGAAVGDPLWRLPLHADYRSSLDSKVADLNNISDGPHGGAITAALFMDAFVGGACPWVHIDVMAWNSSDKPGRPEGGEAMGMRALYEMLEKRFGNPNG